VTNTLESSTLRRALDIVSAVAVTVLACTLTWSTIADRHARAANIRPPRAADTSRPPVPSQLLSLDGAMVKGTRAARIAVVEYSDFQCPYCGLFARNTLPSLEQEYVQTGRVLFAFRSMPLAIHPAAEPAAVAARCAGEQGRFWEMHDSLFADQQHLDSDSITHRANLLQLRPDRFAACLHGDAINSVHQERAGAEALEVTGTPTFFLGALLPDGHVKITNVLTGSQPLATFQSTIDADLKAATAGGHN
jgi:protein-disulfide isomerase